METVYIYGLRDPRYDVVRYVGKASDPEKRLRQHLSDCKTAKSLDNRKKNESCTNSSTSWFAVPLSLSPSRGRFGFNGVGFGAT